MSLLLNAAVQRVECTNCTDSTAVLIALAALLVSVASLYLTSIRRARLELDHVQEKFEFAARSHSGAMPGPIDLDLKFVVTNVGANATVLEALTLYDFEQHGAALWSRLDRDFPGSVTTLEGKWVTFPVVFEGGESRAFILRARLEVSDEVTAADDFARRLATLDSAKVVVAWVYRRPRLLRFWVREPERQYQTLTYDGPAYRDHEIGYWEANGYGEPARLARGVNASVNTPARIEADREGSLPDDPAP